MKKRNVILYVVIGILSIYSILCTWNFIHFKKYYYDALLNAYLKNNCSSYKYDSNYRISEYDKWLEMLSSTGLNYETPDDWKLLELNYYKEDDTVNNNQAHYRAYYKVEDKNSYYEFGNYMYSIIKEIASDNIVTSFNDKWDNDIEHGYYDVETFSECMYNNMYYDLMIDDNTGIRIKVKIKYDDNNNEVILEVNYF